mmetsp:Transcript_134459/g.287673  ORF Transcript_134459/g.287673 Transcript_134459/m.287673 type:complete len:358 (-) Transcript_134459:90-1163(-)
MAPTMLTSPRSSGLRSTSSTSLRASPQRTTRSQVIRTDSQEKLAKLDRMRHDREHRWAEDQKFENSIIEPYLEFANASEVDRLQILNDRVETILRTNANLQEQLCEQEAATQSNQQELNQKQEEWNDLEVELSKSKVEQNRVETQLNELRAQRLAEERRLRSKGVALHEQLAVLTKENSRLEDQRREEEHQMERQKLILEQLERKAQALELRKATIGLNDVDSCATSERSFQQRTSIRPLGGTSSHRASIETDASLNAGVGGAEVQDSSSATSEAGAEEMVSPRTDSVVGDAAEAGANQTSSPHFGTRERGDSEVPPADSASPIPSQASSPPIMPPSGPKSGRPRRPGSGLQASVQE